MRRAKKVDSNQADIVKALRTMAGVTVSLDHDDIFVGYRGLNYWFEIKNPGAVSKKTGKIKESAKKESQKILEQFWCGHYRIVSSLDEIVIDLLGPE